MDSTPRLARLRDFIAKTFTDTLKEPAGALRHAYITPGGPYAKDLWDWDSYWTIRAIYGLARLEGRTALLDTIRPHARGTFLNFLEHQGQDGALPIMLQPKDPDVFECLRGKDYNMAKPFIGQLRKLLLDEGAFAPTELAPHLPELLAFHRCYFDRYLDEKTGLVVWALDWGIGDDDDPAAWGRPHRSCASVYLNTFLYADMKAADAIAQACSLDDLHREYQDRLAALAQAIEKHLWDPRDQAYYSLDVQCRPNHEQNHNFGTLNIGLEAFWGGLRLKVLTWMSALPFWAGLGTQEHFDAFLKNHFTPERLWSDHGIRSLSKDEPMYAPEVPRGNPSNWLGPIWLVANFIVWEMLNTRGRGELASRLADNVTRTLDEDLAANGRFHEYYSPESGRGVCNPGFMSWNALAALMTP
ncbi:MAG: hypothetical protein J6Y80_01495 [Victivallales bacterium]|nr:hypothetical protein [Victivallales bacterium]